MSPKVVIVDLDGTLAINAHRFYLIDKKRGKPNWEEYFLACDKDKPNIPVIKSIRALKKSGYVIHIFSARGKVAFDATVQWLEKHQVPFDLLTMREVGDFTPDEELKQQWLLAKYPNYKDDILCVFDDRYKVVEMWRSLGLSCFQVAPGNF
ncbi:hypothetical protein L1D32_11415 [Shewanella insulae]|uniref:phosphatase domain-containing protein n=1 Tax=Shewanella insulae TaxID=2681496 RepID=UPI001EFEA279|nr:hypothetical protein [Shewanella insulae]MCG9738768.1 hypothetical protein [Shewanella insulae]